MTCEWGDEQVEAYRLGQLEEAERRRFEAHLAACEACRRRLDQARALDEAIGSALRWAEPGAEFAERVMARARRAVWWPRVLAAGAVAAVVCVALSYALLRRPGPPSEAQRPSEGGPSHRERRPAVAGRLVDGSLCDWFGQPVAAIEHGRLYEAAAPAAVTHGQRSLFVMAAGAEFAFRPYASAPETAMMLHSGTLLGQVDPGRETMVFDLAPQLGGAIVRTRGCQFYSRGLDSAGSVWADPLAPGVLEAGAGEICLSVFTGQLEVRLGRRAVRLAPGESCIISCGVTPGPTSALTRRMTQLRGALGEELIARRRRYRRLRAAYARRLLEVRGATGPKAPPYRAERIALLEGLLRAHGAIVSRIEAARPQLFELDAAEAELHRLDLLRDEAEQALEYLIRVVGLPG